MELEHDPDTGCYECQLLNRRDTRCPGHPDRRLFYADVAEVAPDWCPLRAGPVTVRAKRARVDPTTCEHPSITAGNCNVCGAEAAANGHRPGCHASGLPVERVGCGCGPWSWAKERR